MTQHILIAGGGIGGLAAALACTQTQWPVQLVERASAFSEVGAGIQMGPNVTRILQGWGLDAALRRFAAFPERLQARSATSGTVLGTLPLGTAMQQRYGAPYASIHRADLHQLLLARLLEADGVELQLNQRAVSFHQDAHGVRLHCAAGLDLQGQALIGADGLWSLVRSQLLRDAPPRVSGHLAYRALVRQQDLPLHLRSQQVTVWLGPELHVVQYPVRAGECLNVVAIVVGQVDANLDDWDHAAHAEDLRAALVGCASGLRELAAAIEDWRLWPLCDRPPITGAHQQAQGRVALLGDACHPMRPYLAQGAGMAIEDAWCLQSVLAQADVPMAQRLQSYAAQRWQRNARVQARSIRNGDIFHAQGLMRWGRDAALRVAGAALMDQPWLYGAGR